MSRSTDLEGQLAPDFDLDSSAGRVRLADLRGRCVVLYFYPRADTPGCTAETCAFRDLNTEFAALDTVLLGISRDTVADQRKFAEKYGVPFPLLADPETTTCAAYGVWVEKTLYGKKSMGIERTTFVIDREGRIARVYPRVKVENHAAEILGFVRDHLQSPR